MRFPRLHQSLHEKFPPEGPPEDPHRFVSRFVAHVLFMREEGLVVDAEGRTGAKGVVVGCLVRHPSSGSPCPSKE